VCMQGALYFPMIAVPESAWLTRVLLYWDVVGTIVPDQFIEDPEDLDPYTHSLVEQGLLLQVFPSWAEGHIIQQFVNYVRSLPEGALRLRQRSFERGNVTMIHSDKWLTYGAGLSDLAHLRLAERPHYRPGYWIPMERTTAGEFMAALAMALCHPDSRPNWFSRRGHHLVHREADWTPITDSPRHLDLIFSGLEKIEGDDEGDAYTVRRLQSQQDIAAVRTTVLDRLLPVPRTPVSPETIALFRRRHNDLLPAFRRRIESLLDQAASESNENRRYRIIDLAQQEAEDTLERVTAYLEEGGMRRIARSSLIKALRFIPGAAAPLRNLQDLAGATLTEPQLHRHPLAYLAFASVELGPMAYADSPGQLSLADAMMLPL
jgi:hypothetical protein